MSRSQHNRKQVRKQVLNDANAPSALRRAMTLRGSAGAGVHKDQLAKGDHRAVRQAKPWQDPDNWDAL
jgi:hypothetical protein